MPMPSLRPTLLCLTLLAASLSAQAGEKVWISLDAKAFGLLTELQPGLRSQAQRSLVVSVPEGNSGQLRRDQDLVHVVQVDEDLLPRLSDAVHESLHHCGGYVRHNSLAEATQALDAQRSISQRGENSLLAMYPIDNQALVTPMLSQVQDSQILSTIQTLSDFQNRYYTTSHGVSASDHIYNTWSALGAGKSYVSVRQVTHAAWPQKSVVMTITGQSRKKQIIVLGGHMDSILSGGTNENSRAPGADDDASGIASLTEVIRVLMANNYRPERTLEFMAYAAEEVGLRGSDAIARDYKAQRKRVKGVLQLDMTNYQGTATDIYLYTDYTNAAQNQFLANLASTYLPTLKVGYDRCGYGCSDHASWTNQGFPASFPFESSFNTHDPYIHTSNDTLANMGNQAAHAAKFSKLALAYAVELGSDGK
jgi:bacterial leucyl aminopeptidase